MNREAIRTQAATYRPHQDAAPWPVVIRYGIRKPTADSRPRFILEIENQDGTPARLPMSLARAVQELAPQLADLATMAQCDAETGEPLALWPGLLIDNANAAKTTAEAWPYRGAGVASLLRLTGPDAIDQGEAIAARIAAHSDRAPAHIQAQRPRWQAMARAVIEAHGLAIPAEPNPVPKPAERSRSKRQTVEA